MKLALFQNSAPFDILDQRLALSFDATHEAYYPEGFANSAITETVSITNPGQAPVQFELWARYETGQRDQLLRSGTLVPGAWAEVAISDPANPSGILVRPNAPFALVLKSDGELSATLRHDEKGPIVAALQHFNRRGLLGAFLAHGIPGGTISPLNSVLVVPQG